MYFSAHRQNILDQNNSVGSGENRKFRNKKIQKKIFQVTQILIKNY